MATLVLLLIIAVVSIGSVFYYLHNDAGVPSMRIVRPQCGDGDGDGHTEVCQANSTSLFFESAHFKVPDDGSCAMWQDGIKYDLTAPTSKFDHVEIHMAQLKIGHTHNATLVLYHKDGSVAAQDTVLFQLDQQAISPKIALEHLGGNQIR